jgi:hypothetical protein
MTTEPLDVFCVVKPGLGTGLAGPLFGMLTGGAQPLFRVDAETFRREGSWLSC